MQPPPFERYLLTLRLTAPARFHFLHGGVLRGLLSAALEQHELPVGKGHSGYCDSPPFGKYQVQSLPPCRGG
jgi:hypothetical protein